jgi:hypothetical protein
MRGPGGCGRGGAAAAIGLGGLTCAETGGTGGTRAAGGATAGGTAATGGAAAGGGARTTGLDCAGGAIVRGGALLAGAECAGEVGFAIGVVGFASCAAGGDTGRAGGAGCDEGAACCLLMMAFSTSPGLEMCDKSILVLISSASTRLARAVLPALWASPEARKCARTFSASWSSSELECVFFSVTPASTSTSRIALLLTSSSLARSLIRILLIRLFVPSGLSR